MDWKKASDSVDWCSLEDMLKALNFPRRFIYLVLECVCSTKFTLMINGQCRGLSRGKRC